MGGSLAKCFLGIAPVGSIDGGDDGEYHLLRVQAVATGYADLVCAIVNNSVDVMKRWLLALLADRVNRNKGWAPRKQHTSSSSSSNNNNNNNNSSSSGSIIAGSSSSSTSHDPDPASSLCALNSLDVCARNLRSLEQRLASHARQGFPEGTPGQRKVLLGGEDLAHTAAAFAEAHRQGVTVLLDCELPRERACVRVCVRACVHACVCECVCVPAACLWRSVVWWSSVCLLCTAATALFCGAELAVLRVLPSRLRRCGSGVAMALTSSAEVWRVSSVCLCLLAVAL